MEKYDESSIKILEGLEAVRKTLKDGARTPDIAVHGDDEDKNSITLVTTEEIIRI